jgi:hypothetical protein
MSSDAGAAEAKESPGPAGGSGARQITLICACADGHVRSTGRPWRRPGALASPSDASTFGDQLPGSLPKRTAGLPTANKDGLVVPDTLGTRIMLSFLEGLRGPLAWRQRTPASGVDAVTYI